LRREGYVLELWNGDRWYPQMFIRARTAQGESLDLRSPQLLTMTPQDAQGRQREFDYRVRTTGEEGKEWTFPEHFEISILRSDGRVLGTERLTLEIQHRRHLAFESI